MVLRVFVVVALLAASAVATPTSLDFGAGAVEPGFVGCDAPHICSDGGVSVVVSGLDKADVSTASSGLNADAVQAPTSLTVAVSSLGPGAYVFVTNHFTDTGSPVLTITASGADLEPFAPITVDTSTSNQATFTVRKSGTGQFNLQIVSDESASAALNALQISDAPSAITSLSIDQGPRAGAQELVIYGGTVVPAWSFLLLAFFFISPFPFRLFLRGVWWVGGSI